MGISRLHSFSQEYSSLNMQTFQIILLIAISATAAMAYPGYGYGLVGYGHGDYYGYPKYNFEYGVNSLHTGDHKNQWQYRDGAVVKNAYNLREHDRAISRQDLIADVGHYGGGLAYGRYAGGYYGGAASYGNNLAFGGHYGGLYH